MALPIFFESQHLLASVVADNQHTNKAFTVPFEWVMTPTEDFDHVNQPLRPCGDVFMPR